jgi:hypothetical protein
MPDGIIRCIKVTQYTGPLFPGTRRTPCAGCKAELWISPGSQRLMEGMAAVGIASYPCCDGCAAKKAGTVDGPIIYLATKAIQEEAAHINKLRAQKQKAELN